MEDDNEEELPSDDFPKSSNEEFELEQEKEDEDSPNDNPELEDDSVSDD